MCGGTALLTTYKHTELKIYRLDVLMLRAFMQDCFCLGVL